MTLFPPGAILYISGGIMRTYLDFLVELDQLAINRGSELCVAVDVEVEVMHNEEEVQATRIVSVKEHGIDVRNQLANEDLAQIHRVLELELRRF